MNNDEFKTAANDKMPTLTEAEKAFFTKVQKKRVLTIHTLNLAICVAVSTGLSAAARVYLAR